MYVYYYCYINDATHATCAKRFTEKKKIKKPFFDGVTCTDRTIARARCCRTRVASYISRMRAGSVWPTVVYTVAYCATDLRFDLVFTTYTVREQYQTRPLDTAPRTDWWTRTARRAVHSPAGSRALLLKKNKYTRNTSGLKKQKYVKTRAKTVNPCLYICLPTTCVLYFRWLKM